MRNCRNPTISLVAWADRDNKFVFVKVPNEWGRYVRTDPCVVRVPCPACGSVVGEPCRNKQNGTYWASTHADRRTAGDKRRLGSLLAELSDKVDTLDGARVTIKSTKESNNGQPS